MVVMGVVEVRDDPSQVPEGRMHRNYYLHSLVSSRDNLVGHVVVLIFRGIVHKRMVDGLWLMDLNWHRFSVITVAESAIFMNVVLTFAQS
jgi:hypothetical protein